MIGTVRIKSQPCLTAVAHNFFYDVPALVGACIVTVAVLGAVVTPLLADEEGQGLRVLSNVGNNAVLAHAAVGQIVGIARVRLSGHRGDSGLLEADERALCLVLLAPIICK